MKRTPKEKQFAKELISIWLRKNNNNPNHAYAEFIRGHLEYGIDLPYYVTGLDEFISVSKERECIK